MTLREIPPQVSLPFHGVLMPTITISPEQRAAAGAPADCTNLEFLRQLCRNGWKAKVQPAIPRDQWGVYKDRVTMEIDTIATLGFVDYILMVHDICAFADSVGIPRGPGRGSVASSLAAWLLNITDVDPIETGLFFTRFLSKSRAKTTVVDGVTYVDGGLVADIDMDFCYYRRAEVIDYVNRRYPGQTAKLLTTSTLTSRILLKELAKVYQNAPEDQAKEVSGLVEDRNGVPSSIEDSLFGDVKWQTGDEENGKPPNAKLVAWCEQHPDVRELALQLEGLNSGEGVHASALAIAAMPIRELIPLKQVTDKEGTVHVATGYDMYDAQELVLKFDILGLKTLSVLHDCGQALGIDWRRIDVHDPCIYAYLRDFKRRYGIFQLETFAQGTAAAKVKPRTFDELAAVVAIARPGAIAYLSQFAEYVNDGKYTSVHPLVDDILRPTGGIAAFQEQLLQMLNAVGVEPDYAEHVRKCVTKDTKFVSKRRGWITIERLLHEGYKDDVFLVMDECGRQQWKPIREIWSNGTKEVRYVRARNGMWVRSTGWHQFLTDKGWKAKRYIAEDDYLVCAKSIRYDGADVISPDLAIVIAGLVTEGYFVEKNSSTFVNWDKELMAQFVTSFEREFGKDRLSFDPLRRIARVREKEKGIISKTMAFGLSNIKRLPDSMMGMTEDTTRKFLGFMWSCEATVMEEELSFTSASYQLIQQVQLLLLRFDVRSNLLLKKNDEYDRFYFVLYIGQHADVVRFNDAIGPCLCSAKRAIVAKRAATPREENHTTDIVPPTVMSKFIQQYGIREGVGGRVEGGSAYSSGVSTARFKRIASTSKDKYWIDFSNGKHEFTKVESLTDLYDRETEVFDFTVDEDTPYIIANGLVIHNCVGKKLRDKIPEAKANVARIAQENGHSGEVVDLILKVLEDSGNYSFAKAHAVAYSKITAFTLYLKSKHPLHFYWALLQMCRHESEKYEKLGVIRQEMAELGLELLPPHFHHSEIGFKIESDKSIRFALGMIRGISEKKVERLELFRSKIAAKPSKFQVLQDLKNSAIDIGTASSLIQAGCLEGYDSYVDSKGAAYQSRSRLVLEAQTWNLLTDAEKSHMTTVGALPEVGWDVLKAIKHLNEVAVGPKGKPLIIDRRFGTIQKHYAPYKAIYLQNSRNERLANFYYERRTLGFSYSESIGSIFSEHVDGLMTVSAARATRKDTRCRLIGFVGEKPETGKTKAGNAKFRFTLSDETGSITVMAFNDRIGLITEQCGGRLPEESELIIVNCKHTGDGTMFAEQGSDGVVLAIQSCAIYIGLADLKDAKAKEAAAALDAAQAAPPTEPLKEAA